MFIDLADLTVHVQIAGPANAPPLLLLHSLGTNLNVWDAQAEALSRDHRVVRFDMRGHGLTTVTRGPYAIAQLSADVLAIMNALDIASAHVAGLSIGGLMALHFAANAPERVRGLILCDTALALPPLAMWEERARNVRRGGMEAVADVVMARWVRPDFKAHPVASGLRRMLLTTPPEGYASAAEAIGHADLTDAAARITAPALVLVGEDDIATPVESARAIQARIPNATLVTIPRAAHIAPAENPHDVTAAMQRFLAGRN